MDSEPDNSARDMRPGEGGGIIRSRGGRGSGRKCGRRKYISKYIGRRYGSGKHAAGRQGERTLGKRGR